MKNKKAVLVINNRIYPKTAAFGLNINTNPVTNNAKNAPKFNVVRLAYMWSRFSDIIIE